MSDISTNDLPEAIATETDSVLANVSGKSRKTIVSKLFSNVSFSSLLTSSKFIIGSINELYNNMKDEITENDINDIFN